MDNSNLQGDQKTVFKKRVFLNKRCYALDDFIIKQDLFVKNKSILQHTVIKDDLILKKNLMVDGNSIFTGNLNITGNLIINDKNIQETLNILEKKIATGKNNIKSSAAELNILDGAKITTKELNLLHGVKVTTAQINYLKNVTSDIQNQIKNACGRDDIVELSDLNITASAAELNLLDGVTATTTEINYLDGLTSNIQEQITDLQEKMDNSGDDFKLKDLGITARATELNLLDGDSKPGTTQLKKTHGIVTNHNGKMSQTTVDTFDTYLSATTKTLTNKTLTQPIINDGILQGKTSFDKGATIENTDSDTLTITEKITNFDGSLTVTGNLTVNGATTTINTNNTVIKDNLIELNHGTLANINDSGIIIERGNIGDNAFMGWVESNRKFIVGTTKNNASSTGPLNITSGTLITDIEGNVTGDVINGNTIQIGGNNITANVAELNILDGVTATTAELNYLDINTLGTSEPNKVVTADSYGDVKIVHDFDIASHDGINGLKLGGTLVESSAAELNTLNSVIEGTVEASKAVVVDSNKDISSFRNLTATNITATTSLTGELQTSDQTNITSVGTLTGLTVNGNVTIDDGTNDFDIASHNGINGLKLGGSLVKSSAADLNTLKTVIEGTVEASKAVVVDYNKDISSFGNLTATNITSTTLIGELQTTDQPNIVTVGTLTGLEIDGSVNILTGANDFDIESHNGINGLKLGGTLVESSAADLNTLKTVIEGTVTASKAVVVDANRNISSFGNLTADNITATTSLTGKLLTAEQTNITSVGTLTGLEIDGSVNILTGANDFDIESHDGEHHGLRLAGELVTATAEELNHLDGVKFNIQDQLDAVAGDSGNVSQLSHLIDVAVQDNSMYIGHDPNVSGAQYNLAVGETALEAITTGSNNVALGYDALTTNNQGDENTALGSQSLTFNISGNSNTTLGYQAGYTIHYGSNNVCIGCNADTNNNNASNQIVIGQGARSSRDNSVTLGNADVTAVYMAEDSTATVHCGGLFIDNHEITATAAELNILDGVTATTAELSIMDGVTADASELNLLDGAIAGNVVNSTAVIYGTTGEVNATTLQIEGTSITASAAELNILDGDTSPTSITVGPGDRVVLNDDGTMVQVAVNDLAAYFDDAITAMPNLVTTGATTVGNLNSGSITSGFGDINTGNSAITTTGTITYGTLRNGDTDISASPAELNLVNGASAGNINNSKAVIYGSGGEVNATELQIAGNTVNASVEQLNYLTITQGLGYSQSGKVVTADLNGNVTIRNELPGTKFTIASHDGNQYGLVLGDVLVTATAEQINFLDGVDSNIKDKLDELASASGASLITDDNNSLYIGGNPTDNTDYEGTTHLYNVGIGFGSLNSNTIGNNNTALGYQSLNSNSDGTNNTAIGYHSLVNNTSGTSNTAIGYQSLQTNDDGNNNTAIGYQSLNINTADNNTAIGYQSLKANQNGDYNTAIGYHSLLNNTSGASNTAIGYQSLENTISSDNTAIGYQSLRSNTSGTTNTAIGYQSLLDNSTGSSNTAIGYQAGNQISDGTKNVCIGCNADTSDSIALNQIVIGDGATGQDNNSVTLGNADVTAVYMAQDSTATVHCSSVILGASAPAAPDSTGSAGEIRVVGDYIYICKSEQPYEWVRVQLTDSSWGSS